MRKITRYISAVLIVVVLVIVLAVLVRPRPMPIPDADATAAPTIPGQPSAQVSPTAKATATRAATRAATSAARPTATKKAAATAAGALACEFIPVTAQMVEELQAEAWMAWIRQLSGADPVVIGGEETRITTRWTPAMFGQNGEPQPNARAFEYVLETVRGWYPEAQIEVQTHTGQSRGGDDLLLKNLVLTLPGVSKPGEVVILSAHLDSVSNVSPEKTAPGAEDNASGSAALLEAARLFRDYQFERTIRVIWFTGEEQGLVGSRMYIEDLANPQEIIGVVNLDMFGYDSDGDRCFELHVGTLPASDRIGRCFVQSAEAYQQELDTYDYLTSGATGSSDHGTFWQAGIGAIEVLENLFANNLSNGCANADRNPGYHSPQDTVEKINPDSGIRIVRAALATAAAMAGPVE